MTSRSDTPLSKQEQAPAAAWNVPEELEVLRKAHPYQYDGRGALVVSRERLAVERIAESFNNEQD